MSDIPNQDRPQGACPARSWLIGLGVLALIGLGDSAYLSVLHWQVHNLPGHVSFCAVSEQMNCDTVALSRYSQFASVPNSTWGGLVYLGLLVIAGWGLWARRPTFPWALASAASGLMCGASAFLFLVSELTIQSYCIMCMSLYAVNLLAALMCVLGGRRAGLPPAALASLPLFGLLIGAAAWAVDSPDMLAHGWAGLAALGGGAFVGLVLLNVKGARARLAAWGRALRFELGIVFASPRRTFAVVLVAVLTVGGVVGATLAVYPPARTEIAGGLTGLAHGRTPEGHAWIGAEHPEVTITEYSDYECPFCGHAHEAIRKVIREDGDWLRLVHVHMPLDQACNHELNRPFHRHSCACARAAECAGEQGAFWQMNDRLFLRRGGLDSGGLVVLAENMGLDPVAFRECMDSARAAKVVAANLAECRRLHLRPATPTFRIGGQIVIGMKPVKWWTTMAKRLRTGSEHESAPPGDMAEHRGGEHGGPARPGSR